VAKTSLLVVGKKLLTFFSLPIEAQRKKLCKKEMP
jgi:hypothetical protein